MTMRTECVCVAAFLLLSSCTGAKGVKAPPASALSASRPSSATNAQPIVVRKSDVIRGYEEFLKQYGNVDPALRSEALKRLGDLYLERAHQRFLAKMEAYDKQPQGPPPLEEYTDATQVYEQLLRTDPTFHAQDQVLYALARAYSETGRRELAQPLLTQLVTDYPASPHRQEAYFRLGEYAFDQRRFEEAAQAYEQALSLDEPFFLDKARYKLGWAYFNLQAYPKAIENFLRLVDQQSAGRQDLASDTGSLVWEALTYVTLSFRTLGGPSTMAAYFREKGARTFEKDLYLMMGNQYAAEGSVPQAIDTYRTFVRVHPLHPMAPIFSSYVVEAYERQKDANAARDARMALVGSYSSASAWDKANDEASRERARPLVKDNLSRLGISAHTRAREDKQPEEYRQAVGWYRQFLLEFPGEKETREIHLFLAESLFALQEYAEAATAYEAVAYNYAGLAVDRQAAYSAIVATEKLADKQGQERFIGLAKRFAQQFPNDARTPTVLLKSGELLFEQQRDAEARDVLGRVLSRYPKFTGTATAQKLVAHSYMRQGRYQEARAAYAATLTLLPATEKAQRREVSDLVAAAMYKEAEQQRKDDDVEAAAKTFAAISREAPGSALATSALFEAAGLYETLKRPQEALTAYQSLLELVPQSDLAGKAALQMGLLYQQRDQPLEAAEAFETAAQSIHDQDAIPQILWTAGLQYENASRWERSYGVFSQFAERFPKHPDVPEGLLKMAQALQHQGKTKDALKVFAQVEQQAPGSLVAAQAVFAQAEESLRALKRIALKEPFKANLKKKTQALEKTVSLYTHAAESRYLEVVATSAYRLGEVFEHFKTALLEAQLPKKLSQEQVEEYRFQLEEKAFPFEEKAVQAYASNVQRASSQPGAYNEWVKKSYDRLAELRPSLYKRPERAERLTSNIDVDTLTASRGPATANEVVAAGR
ncbi:MAG: tetratricopeptide repeat protein [Nitrospirae bacterium]|nr:tetratricopeptide repeat protein [Nitrospirota bacterium]